MVSVPIAVGPRAARPSTRNAVKLRKSSREGAVALLQTFLIDATEAAVVRGAPRAKMAASGQAFEPQSSDWQAGRG
jgi:hypothetical protein